MAEEEVKMPTRPVLLALLLGALAGGAHADDCRFPAEVRGERPDASAGSTPVALGLFLIDLVEVDERGQSFTANFNVNLRWRDPRLARPGYAKSVCVVPLESIWNPKLRILNERDLRRKLDERAVIDAKGNVAYDQRYYGSIQSIADLSDFPFDRRTLAFELVTIDFDESQVALVRNDARTGRQDLLSVANWDVGAQHMEPASHALVPNRVFTGSAATSTNRSNQDS